MSDELWAAVAAGSTGTLATIKRDGRPQLSVITYTADPESRIVRISTRAGLAKVHNLGRDPRASMLVHAGRGYAVAEGTVELTPVAADEHDATVEELIEVYRLAAGREHPDWDDYRRAMVADRRLVLRLTVTKSYGWITS